MFRFAITSLFLATAPAFAQSGLPADGSILPGWREADGQHMAGLSIRLQPGWKTYWRAPGDGGIPPRFNWSGSQNLSNVEVRYPVPDVMDQNGMQSIGYETDVVFPLLVSPQDASQPIQLTGTIEIGVCEEICIPMAFQVVATLPAKGSHDPSIANALDDKPNHGGALKCDIAPISDGLRLRASSGMPKGNQLVAIVETGEPGVWISPPVLSRDGNRLVAEVEMVAPTAKPFALARSDVRMTVLSSAGAVEMIGCE